MIPMAPVFPAPPVDANGNPLTIYPVSALAKFQGYTRATFMAAFGFNPPNFDPSWPVQGWFDPSALAMDPTAPYSYSTLAVGKDGSTPILNQMGQASLKQITIPAGRAAKLNLPGLPAFSGYIVAATAATGISDQPINPIYLSTLDQAEALVAALDAIAPNNCTAPEEQLFLLGPGQTGFTYPSTEPRRMYVFTFKGSMQYVGLLLLAQNAAGVGSPGYWDCSGFAPVWISTPANPGPQQWSAAHSQPVPLRALIPGETIQEGMFGVGVLVSRVIPQGGN